MSLRVVSLPVAESVCGSVRRALDMVGRDVDFVVHKEEAKPGDVILDVEGMTVASKVHHNNAEIGRASCRERV